MSEWLKVSVLKTDVCEYRGFESHLVRKQKDFHMNKLTVQSFFLLYLSEIRWKFFLRIARIFFLFCVFLYTFRSVYIFIRSSSLYNSSKLLERFYHYRDYRSVLYCHVGLFLRQLCVFSSFFFYLILTFFRSSYYDNESFKALLFFSFSLSFFCFSHIITFFFLLPMFCSFLLYFDTQHAIDQGKFMISFIELEPRLFPYISFTLKILWGSHFICQTPLLAYLIFLCYRKNSFFLLQNRRYVYFLLLLFAAFISPPDVNIQFFCFFLLLGVFEALVLSFIVLYNYSKK